MFLICQKKLAEAPFQTIYTRLITWKRVATLTWSRHNHAWHLIICHIAPCVHFHATCPCCHDTSMRSKINMFVSWGSWLSLTFLDLNPVCHVTTSYLSHFPLKYIALLVIILVMETWVTYRHIFPSLIWKFHRLFRW